MSRALAQPSQSPAPVAAAARVARFADALEVRLRRHASLLELFRAHLDARSPGRSGTVAEHALELVELGLRWREAAERGPEGARREPSPGELDRMLARAEAGGRRAAELRRLRAWCEFVEREGTLEVLPDALDLATWFEETSRDAFAHSGAPVEERVAPVRAELVARDLRQSRRAAGFEPRGRV